MSHKIVVLDGIYANPGDLSWDALNDFGNTTIYKQTKPSEVVEKSKDASILIINKIKLGKAQFEQLPNLKLIVISATGMDNVDLEEADKLGIKVKNVSNYSTASVAQHTFALILSLTNKTNLYDQSVKSGEWNESKGFSYILHTLPELSQRSLGIYGFGAIGKAVAKIGAAFGMKVKIVSGHADPSKYSNYEFVDEKDLFTECDIVSLHCPLTDDNKSFVNKGLISLMKPDAFLINTARGALINEVDLHWALSNHRIGGAALDVLSQEPPITTHPLSKLDNCIITPHMAWTSLRSRKMLIEHVVNYVKDFY
ncbi:MAG: D-2-hydroxyacid dehydrogenase [Marinoscillum sp.]